MTALADLDRGRPWRQENPPTEYVPVPEGQGWWRMVPIWEPEGTPRLIAPMLCTTRRDPSCLWDPRYVAEPKFDGQRAQVHVAGGRTVAAFSCPGRSQLIYPGMAGLRDARWPVDQVVLDGELCASTGMEGILGVFEARERRDAPVAFLGFDVLSLNGREVMSEPWADRRKRLEDLGAALTIPNVAIVPATDDAAQLWAPGSAGAARASS